MNIVLDTNVLVSGLLNPFGPPGKIVRMVAAGMITLCYDARIMAEYREVLLQPQFPFHQDVVDGLLSYVQSKGVVAAASPLALDLPDSDDEAFLEVALSAGAEFLVTGNLPHYPPGKRQGMRVLSPAQFLDLLGKEQPG